MRTAQRKPIIAWILSIALVCPPSAFAETNARKVASVDRGARKRLIKDFTPSFVIPGGSANGQLGLGGAGGSGTDSDSQLGGNGSSSSTGAAGKGGAGGLGGLGGLNGLGGANGKGAANTGGGGNPPAATQKTEFDDSASKNRSGRPISGGNGPGAGNPQAKAYPQWYPMCLFIDPQAANQAQANATIKGMTAAMAKCEVNLVVFPVTVAPGSYPNVATASDQVNSMQSSACNIAGNVDNAERASTSICVNNTQMADHMCQIYKTDANGNRVLDTDTAGCAQLNSSGAEKKKYDEEIAKLEKKAKGSPPDAAAQKRLDDIKAHNQGSGAGGGSSPIAPSIEDLGACTNSVVSHEAIGHSMFGHPNGKGDGFGIGFEEGGDGDGWTDEGCLAIRRNAFTNDGKWKYEPARETYYVEPKDPSAWWQLDSGRQLFNKPNNPPGNIPAIRPPLISDAGNTIVMDDGAAKGSNDAGSAKSSKSSGKGTGGGQLSSTPPTAVDPRHRLRPRPAGEEATGGTRKAGTPIAGASEEVIFPEKPRLSPPNNKPVGTKSVGFDDDAAKGESRGGGGSAVGNVGSLKVDKMPGGSFGRGGEIGGGGSGGSSGFAFDDDAGKGEASGSTPGRSGGGAGAGPGESRSGGFAFDDEASKGAPGGVGAAVGMTGSAERSPSGVGPATFGQGKALGGSSGFSGNEFFGNVGRDGEDSSDEESDEKLRQRRRRQKVGERVRGIDGEVARRGRNGRTPRSIPGNGEAP